MLDKLYNMSKIASSDYFMSVHYNLVSRRNLKNFMQKPNKSYTLHSIYDEARTLHTDYKKNKEKSLVAQIDFLKSILEKNNDFYDTQIYSKKSWWKKIFYFFGWVPKDESRLLSLNKSLKKQIQSLEKMKFSFDFLDKWVLSIVDEQIDSLVDSEKDIDRQLSNLSHRSLLSVTDVPDYLEGNASVTAYRDYVSDLNDYISTLPEQSEIQLRLKRIAVQLKSCEEQEGRVLRHRTQTEYLIKNGRHQDVQTLNEQLHDEMTFEAIKKIDNLCPGESALFSHGFASTQGGHATLFEVEKLEKDSSVFLFINTGYGVQKSYSWLTLIVDNVFGLDKSPAKKTSPIDIDELVTGSLMPELLAPRITTAPDIKTGLQNMLQPLSELQRQGRLLDDDHQIKHQKMGSCSQSCIDAWFERQCKEAETIPFQIFRLKKTLSKIDLLLRNNTLNLRQREACRHMRVAVYVELRSLQARVNSLNENTRNILSNSLADLKRVREENSEAKDKTAKPVNFEDPDELDRYCKIKTTQPLNSKFSSQEQLRIKNASRETVSVKTASRTFLLFGKKRKLSDEEIQENKLNKVLLAKQIMHASELSNRYSFLQQNLLQQSGLNEEETKRIDQLVAYQREKGSVPYYSLQL